MKMFDDGNSDARCLEKWQAVQNFYLKNNKNFLNFAALHPDNAVKAAWELEHLSRLLMKKDNETILSTLENRAAELFTELRN